MQHDAARRALLELTSSFPDRLTGSPGAEGATAWAEGKMREIGLARVHREAFALTEGWQRGHARVHVVGDGGPLAVSAFGWTGSTVGSVRARALRVADTEAAPSVDWKGRALLVALSPVDAASFYALPSLVERARDAGALAVLVRDDRPGGVHTGPLGFPGRRSELPVLSVRADAFEALARAAPEGREPVLELDVANRFVPGPVPSWNVLGELPGTEEDAGLVLLAAHLDAWDVSPGVSDDAYGVATVLDAARRLRLGGSPPRRTVRFALFTGEEQGLLGSRAYVRAHAEARARLECAIAVDWGSGPFRILTTSGHDEAVAPLHALLATPSPGLTARRGYLLFTDAFAFSAVGVAGMAFLQDSPSYGRDGHSADDSLARADLDTLDGNAQRLAALARGLADAPAPVARRLSPTEVRREMDEVHAPAELRDPAERSAATVWDDTPGAR